MWIQIWDSWNPGLSVRFGEFSQRLVMLRLGEACQWAWSHPGQGTKMEISAGRGGQGWDLCAESKVSGRVTWALL